MHPRYRSAAENDCYFATDDSGVVFYSAGSGDTHFLHVDPSVLKVLLTEPDFGIDELGQALSLDFEEASELIERLLATGLIDASS